MNKDRFFPIDGDYEMIMMGLPSKVCYYVERLSITQEPIPVYIHLDFRHSNFGKSIYLRNVPPNVPEVVNRNNLFLDLMDPEQRKSFDDYHRRIISLENKLSKYEKANPSE